MAGPLQKLERPHVPGRVEGGVFVEITIRAALVKGDAQIHHRPEIFGEGAQGGAGGQFIGVQGRAGFEFDRACAGKNGTGGGP
jgi:hypothetical protein